MHETAFDYVRSVVETVKIPKGPVLEIGGRDINGTVRPLFDHIGPYASVDLRDGPGVDLVGDVCTLGAASTARTLFMRKTVACVVCCEVLEHAPDGRGMCRWAARILATRGVFIVTAANPQRFEHSGIDGGNLHPGEYYCGVSRAMLSAWLKPFKRFDITENGADIYAVAWRS